jgi:hypothetical protein
MLHSIIWEIIKAFFVGTFLYTFYFYSKKAFQLGKYLDIFCQTNNFNLLPIHKKKIQKILLKKFLLKSSDTSLLEQFLNEYTETNEFKTNLIP